MKNYFDKFYFGDEFCYYFCQRKDIRNRPIEVVYYGYHLDSFREHFEFKEIPTFREYIKFSE